MTAAADLIGRLVERTENSDVTTFTFDTATYGIGKLAEVARPQDYYSKTFAYDDKGRPSTTTTELPNVAGTAVEHTFVTGQSFDPEGRLDLVTYPASTAYPSGLQVRYTFNDHGYLEEARNDDTGNALFWQRDVATPTLSQVTLGNGVTTTHSFHADTGRLYRIRSTDATPFDIQDLEYAFDSLGNLTERSDHNRGLIERVPASGGYDALNRLTKVERYNGTTSQWDETAAVSYDTLGNVLGKTGKGAYDYDAVGCGTGGGGPHAVKTIGTQALCYDDNGNETQGYNFEESRTRTTAWTAFNKPASITEGGDSIAFEYGPDRARFRQVNDFTGVTTLYVDGLFELETVSGVDTAVHYIYAGGEAVAIYKSPESGSAQTLYLHRDHLGSVVEITDESGAIYQSLSYDAFGKRRDPDDWGPPVGPPDVTKRGYTGHEHLDDVGITHMNGRVYDPDTARMLSADPYVAFPTYSQSYNRYAYVLNNPLNLVDPSGFCPVGSMTSEPVDGNGRSTGSATCVGGGEIDTCDAQCQAGRQMDGIVARSSIEEYWRVYGVRFLAGSESLDWGWAEGVIGWTTVSISVSYQGMFWPVFSGSVANNAMTGADTHPAVWEKTERVSAAPGLWTGQVPVSRYEFLDPMELLKRDMTPHGAMRAYTPTFRDNFAGRTLQSLDFGLGWALQWTYDGPVRGMLSNDVPSPGQLIEAQQGLLVGMLPIGRLAYGTRAARAAAARDVSYRLGEAVTRIDSYEWATMSPAQRIAAVVEKYGINLRGKSVVFDSSLGTGQLGMTSAANPNVLRVGSGVINSEQELASTIAHELRHSRAYLGSGSNSEAAAGASEQALREYIQGVR